MARPRNPASRKPRKHNNDVSKEARHAKLGRISSMEVRAATNLGSLLTRLKEKKGTLQKLMALSATRYNSSSVQDLMVEIARLQDQIDNQQVHLERLGKRRMSLR